MASKFPNPGHEAIALAEAAAKAAGATKKQGINVEEHIGGDPSTDPKKAPPNGGKRVRFHREYYRIIVRITVKFLRNNSRELPGTPPPS